MSGSGGSTAQSNDTDNNADSGDDNDSGSESEFRGYRGGYRGYRHGRYGGYRYGGFRAPAFRFRAGFRPYRYGVGRPFFGSRYPSYGRPFRRGRSPGFGRRFAGRGAWPFRRFYGGRVFSPLGYRRWPWLHRRFYGDRPPLLGAPAILPGLPPPPPPAMPAAGGDAPGSPWITLVQGCLQKLLGPDSTPVDGALGPQTRSALRAFQQQNGLPPTGDIDNPTVQALQGACLGSGGAPGGAPGGAEPAGPPPDGGGGPQGAEPPAGGAAPGGAPPPDGAAPPNGAAAGGGDPSGGGAPSGAGAPRSEITLGRHEGEFEQEFLVDGPARIDVERHDPVPIDSDPIHWAPDAPGLHVITPAARRTSASREQHPQAFLQRRKALNDLQIPVCDERAIGRLVPPALSTVPRGAIQRRDQAIRVRVPAVVGQHAILRILEQVYIKRLGNRKATSRSRRCSSGRKDRSSCPRTASRCRSIRRTAVCDGGHDHRLPLPRGKRGRPDRSVGYGRVAGQIPGAR